MYRETKVRCNRKGEREGKKVRRMSEGWRIKGGEWEEIRINERKKEVNRTSAKKNEKERGDGDVVRQIRRRKIWREEGEN